MVAHEPRLHNPSDVSPLLGQLDKHGGSFWEKALCATSGDPDAWFIDYGQPEIDELWRLNNALRICSECPIQQKCLEVGMTETEIKWGIWGGLFPGERMLLVADGKKLSALGKQAVLNAKGLREKIENMKVRANKGRVLKRHKNVE